MKHTTLAIFTAILIACPALILAAAERRIWLPNDESGALGEAFIASLAAALSLVGAASVASMPP
ncbi:MAG: hypothetical protein NTV08_15605 [Verrucomicrobia bacterium]|nr:hypothetical protein [Verrucomicrobiota bacterium]